MPVSTARRPDANPGFERVLVSFPREEGDQTEMAGKPKYVAES